MCIKLFNHNIIGSMFKRCSAVGSHHGFPIDEEKTIFFFKFQPIKLYNAEFQNET